MFGTRRTTKDPFRSRRSAVMARHGMVCTSQPLASATALECLRLGGDAVDAAVTAVAVLGIVEPYNTGIGGDCFMLVWRERERRLYGLNGSGRAPAAATVDAFRERGLTEIPYGGMLAVTVPGAVDAWCEALERFGRRSLADALQPAIAYAEEGFPVSELVGYQWSLIASVGLLRQEDAARTFTIDGKGPSAGTVVRLPQLADSLRRLAAGGRDEFYRGWFAERIVEFSRANGGLFEMEDFTVHRSDWVEPISTAYRGHRVCEIPPNGQGLAALIALNVLECFDLARYPLGSPESLHLRIEAMKLAFVDRNRYVADPEAADVPTEELLSKDYAQGRAALIRPDKAIAQPSPGRVRAGSDTVYLTVADGEGNVVSMINSLYGPFGSGMVVGDTGIALQNRGRGFVLEPSHPNCIAPRKRPLHTIIPAMIFAGERPLVSFGVMGGDMQAQGHLQVVSNLVDYGLNIQEALDCPRFHYLDANRVALEDEHGAEVRAALSRRGHAVEGEDAALLHGGFGGGQGIAIEPETRVYWGGSDWRKDGVAVGW